MALLKSLNTLGQKFSWSFASFILAIIFGLLSIYLGFLKDDSPDLSYILTSNSNVLDINASISNLDVLYKGESINKKNKALRIITFKVINTGHSSILSTFYDSKDPVGFQIENGNIADKPVLINASNSYLKDNVQIIVESNGQVKLSDPIIESGEFFEIKVLVLHAIESTPKLTSFGKIAGVKTISVISDNEESVSDSFVNNIFGGGIKYLIIKFIVYGIIFLFLTILCILMVVKITDVIDKRKRKETVKLFKNFDSEKIANLDEYIFNSYVQRGSFSVKEILDSLKNEYDIRLFLELNKDENKHHRDIIYLGNRDIIEALLEKGIVKVNKSEILIEPERIQVADEFFKYLKRKGEYPDVSYDYEKPQEEKEALFKVHAKVRKDMKIKDGNEDDYEEIK